MHDAMILMNDILYIYEGRSNSEWHMNGVCRQCFSYFYEIGDTNLVELCNLVKKGEDNVVERELTDKAAGYKYSEVLLLYI
jgi:hypothetical protein